eukprot:910123-Alexandrium_andersonii.AAC.1
MCIRDRHSRPPRCSKARMPEAPPAGPECPKASATALSKSSSAGSLVAFKMIRRRWPRRPTLAMPGQ